MLKSHHLNSFIKLEMNFQLPLIEPEPAIRLALVPIGVNVRSKYEQVFQCLSEKSKIETNNLLIRAKLNKNLHINLQYSKVDSLDDLVTICKMACSPGSCTHLNFHIVIGLAMTESHNIMNSSKIFFDKLKDFSSYNVFLCSKDDCPSQNSDSFTNNTESRNIFYPFLDERSIPNMMNEIYSELISSLIEKVKGYKIRSSEYIIADEIYQRGLFRKLCIYYTLQNYSSCSKITDSLLSHHEKLPLDILLWTIDIAIRQGKVQVDKYFKKYVSLSLTRYDYLKNIEKSSNGLSTLFYLLNKNKDFVLEAKILLRNLFLFPEETRRSILLRILEQNKGKSDEIRLLCILLLFKIESYKTYLFFLNDYIGDGKDFCPILYEPTVISLTKSTGFLNPKLYLIKNVYEKIENKDYLRELSVKVIQELHEANSEVQKTLLICLSGTSDLDLSSIYDNIRILRLPKENCINDSTKSQVVQDYRSNKTKTINDIFSVGEEIMFNITFKSKLKVDIDILYFSLLVENGIAIPNNDVIPEAEGNLVTLCVYANSRKNIIVKGVSLVTKNNIEFKYLLSEEIVINIIDIIPTLDIIYPFQNTEYYENSNIEIAFEIINNSPEDVQVKHFKGEFVSSEGYKPSMTDILPINCCLKNDTIIKGNSINKFVIQTTLDKARPNISFELEYGIEKYTRITTNKILLSIKEGPSIIRLQHMPDEDCDDFKENSNRVIFIINNPLDSQIEVGSGDSKILVGPKCIGSIIEKLPKYELSTSIESIGREQINKYVDKCTSELKRNVSEEEKKYIIDAFALKFEMSKLVDLTWRCQNGLNGKLPLAYLDVTKSLLGAFQAPPFEVDIKLMKGSYDSIYDLKTYIKMSTLMDITGEYDISVSGDEEDQTIFVSGPKKVFFKSNCAHESLVHCTGKGTLKVRWLFAASEATYRRIETFDLSKYVSI